MNVLPDREEYFYSMCRRVYKKRASGSISPLEDKTKRMCLKCSKFFTSAGPYNRLCGKCNDRNAKHVNREYYPDPN